VAAMGAIRAANTVPGRWPSQAAKKGPGRTRRASQ
jgi:hypothetical protein